MHPVLGYDRLVNVHAGVEMPLLAAYSVPESGDGRRSERHSAEPEWQVRKTGRRRI
jgi:hypothetical protein